MNRRLMSILFVSFTFLIMAMLACRNPTIEVSETQQPIEVKKEVKSPLASLNSPYEIEKYINENNGDADLKEIWGRFEIVSENLKPVKCGCRGYDCPGNCVAETIETNSKSNKEPYVILRICYTGETDCGFFLFKKENDWKYLGLAESVLNQYKPPQHKIVKNGDAQWLVIRELWGRGTGFIQYGERWFVLNDTGVKEVLSYPVSGHSVQGSSEDYQVKSKVLHRVEQNTFIVDVLYTEFGNAKYKNDRQWMSFKLNWRSSDKYRMHFIWDNVTEKFVFDESNSHLPQSKDDPIVTALFPKPAGR